MVFKSSAPIIQNFWFNLAQGQRPHQELLRGIHDFNIGLVGP